ncbi:MAG: hypothetical protein KBG15_11775 [Kofleriaceae bacterium]|nr:hypothetical protein [Kofleriaceae bacterium]
MGSFKDLAKLKGFAEAGLLVRTAKEQNADRREAELRKIDDAKEAAAAAVVANAPHYPWARVGTLAEVRALLDVHATAFSIAERKEIEATIDIAALVHPAQIADGDHVVDSLLMPADGTSLYVLGNLTVHHRVVQRFRAGTLVVFGSLRAQHVITTGQILVVGNLDVTGTMYGNSTNYATTVLGAARVGTLISAKEHLFSLLGGHSLGELVALDASAPNFAIYARSTPLSTRTLDPAVGDPHDAAAVAAALGERNDVLMPAR